MNPPYYETLIVDWELIGRTVRARNVIYVKYKCGHTAATLQRNVEKRLSGIEMLNRFSSKHSSFT